MRKPEHVLLVVGGDGEPVHSVTPLRVTLTLEAGI